MSFGREKRLLLGWLALLAPLPLPFNQILAWPILVLYELLVIHFLQRTERGSESGLPKWLLNLLGFLYLPVFWVDLQLVPHRDSGFAGALLHLIMFLVVVKLYALRVDRDKWHLVVAVFFLFLGAMATSSHLTIAVYLIAFFGLSLFVLGRLSLLHVAERVAQTPVPGPPPVFARGLVLTMVLAVPLFAAAPRFRDPYILGRGAGSMGSMRSAGFSDSVDLSLMSSIRTSRDVALRVHYRGGDPTDPNEVRFKGAAFDHYRDQRWHRADGRRRPIATERGVYRLAPGTARGEAEIFLEPLGSSALLLPVEALELEVDNAPIPIWLDPGGGLALSFAPRSQISYRVRLAEGPVIAAGIAGAEVDEGGITARIRDLAVEVAGEGSAAEQAARIERHLSTRYSYTLDFVGREGSEPLEEFLFVHQSGHCEYFASAMVLMLRAVGIPARLVTGFLGSEYNPLEGHYVVRQGNAHAWVEAHTPSGGWAVYDPTPPDGRPQAADQGLRLLLAQLWDFMIFRWDRYVLTFGAEDQAGLFRRLGDSLSAWLARLWGELAGDEPAPLLEETVRPAEPGAPGTHPPLAGWRVNTGALVLLLLLAGGGLLAWWSRRPPASGTEAYRLLLAQLRRAGLDLAASVAPLRLERLAARRFPAAAVATRSVVRLYLRESFRNETLSGGDRAWLKQALDTLRRALSARPPVGASTRPGGPATGAG